MPDPVYMPLGNENRIKAGDDGSIWSRRVDSQKWRRLTVSMRKGLPTVNVMMNGQYVRRYLAELILEAFVGPAPAGKKPIHANGQFKDCRACNLSWGERQKRGLIDDAMQFDLDDMTDDDRFRILELYWIRGADKISIANNMELEYRTVQYVIDNNPRLTAAQPQ